MIQSSVSLLILFPLYNYFSALYAIILYALSFWKNVFIHQYHLKSIPFLESCVFLRSFLRKLLTEASDSLDTG